MTPQFQPYSGRAMTDAERAWVAGFLEGEGSFLLLDGRGPRVSAQSTDLDVLERVKETTGLGRVYVVTHRAGRKPCWQWMVCRRNDATRLMEELRPLMGERRVGQIDRVLGVVARDENEEPSVLDSPPIFPLVITWDEEGGVHVDVGTMNLYEAYGVLIAAAEAIKEEVPFVSVTGAWANVSDSDDEDDD